MTGPTETVGIALEVIETLLMLPSNRKALENIIEYTGIQEQSLKEAAANLRHTLETA